MEELINVHVFNPRNAVFKSGKKEKAECNRIFCSNKDNCGLYKNNQCVCLNIFKSNSCEYGHRSREVGFTSRARACSSWISERTTKYENVLDVLKSPSRKIAKIGEYYYLPYAYINSNKNVKFLNHGSLFSYGSEFIHENDFNVETIKNIIEYRPQAMMGGEITDYQKKSVPLFVQHLIEEFPVLFEEVKNVLPEITKYLSNDIYIGRKALLKTLLPGTIITSSDKKETWEWDGNYLKSTNHHILFSIVPYNGISVTIQPLADATVTITDISQVHPGISFID